MSENDTQGIEQLRVRYDGLNTRKIQAETNLKNAESQLNDLKHQAMESYKTDDIAELTQLLKELEKENERKRTEYVSSLDQIENDLAKVEKKYADVDADTVA